MLNIEIIRMWDKVSVKLDDYYHPDWESGEFMWTDGNYACDCNRHIVFEDAQGREADDDGCVCGDTRYRIRAFEGDKLVYDEMEESAP